VAGQDLAFNYGISANGGATDSVFRSVQVNSGPTYEYYYDSRNRRRAKVYPTGDNDEFFYRFDDKLLEDRSVTLLGQSIGSFPIDEYIWLDGRPVALVKSLFLESAGIWTRQVDGTGDCSRNGEAAPCGIYFPVTDLIDKPVVMLNSAAQVTGLGDYQPFGALNTASNDGHTPHPYPQNDLRVLAYFSQQHSSQIDAELRARFSLVDTAGPSDYAYFAGHSGVELSGSPRVGGSVSGEVVSPWIDVPSDGQIKVQFRSGANAGSHYGVSLVGYEFRRQETGVRPVWTPLRFSGQYYDSETNLIQNWNRFYDPLDGRYLASEPISGTPGMIKGRLLHAKSTPIFGYSQNNPVSLSDATGLYDADWSCSNLPGEDELYRELQRTVSLVAKDYYECIMRQIDKAHIECSLNTAITCALSNTEASSTGAYTTLGTCSNPVKDVHWCDLKGRSKSCQAKGIIHELAHTCGWDHHYGGGIPGDSGELTCQ